MTDAISFGPFSLVPNERLLTRDGTAVQLGGRTLDTLIALISRPNEIISKRDLMSLVWPDATVEEASLRFHIAGLRKALGDGQDGARYITTLSGRGYCFVAPVSFSSGRAEGDGIVAISPGINLPARLTRMVGRAADVRMISDRLTASRFVTIVGSGGVGKTTVAVAVAHDLPGAVAEAVVFVDLGLLGDPDMVPTSIASMLGLSILSSDPTPSLVAYLRDKRILLILDNCEHVIDVVAGLASRIFLEAPRVHILATSREILRVEGEQVHRLAPLAVPPDDPDLSASSALEFPAMQLFMERATASGARLGLGKAEASIVAGICRKLDGVALAIELAAGRVKAYGLQQTAAMLEERLSRSWLGQRTAPPRQKTLQATLDWSYELLSAQERLVLRRLAVFVGDFTMEAALAVATSATVDQTVIFGAIDGLVAKSMVTTRPSGAMMRYRLLDTTRAYVLDIGTDETELSGLAERHALYYRRWLEQIGPQWPTLSNPSERLPYLVGLNNVRAGLEWCFGAKGNPQTGIRLAAAATPVFLRMSLLPECLRWSQTAILALDDDMHAGSEEMYLQAALGLSLMLTRGNSEAAHAAVIRSLAIAEERDDALNQLQLLGLLHTFHYRHGNFRAAMHDAERGLAVSRIIAEPAATAFARSLLGISLHIGVFRGARTELEAALQHTPPAQRTGTIQLGFDYHIWTGVALARTLWLEGYPDQAVARIRQIVKDAASADQSVTLSIALARAVSVFLWTGDLQGAEEYIDWSISHAEAHCLAPYLAAGRGYRGELAIRRGEPQAGTEILERCLGELHATNYQLLNTPFRISLVQGLAALGRSDEALLAIDELIRVVEVNGDLSYMPELLRVKSNVLLSASDLRHEDAEACLVQSLDWARRLATRAWELRSTTDLAGLWASQGRPEAACELLQPIFEQFTEGFETADLRAAEALLVTLGRQSG
ncbi:ATP-binding protein [Shinella sp.]|uniref:ATP-binding protein n=1 Tax=Shinella sp. TaxID=1870904 RepID=UPI003F6EE921